VELLSDDHLAVRGSSHCRIGGKWLVACVFRSKLNTDSDGN
jgi:hypothetical protein